MAVISTLKDPLKDEQRRRATAEKRRSQTASKLKAQQDHAHAVDRQSDKYANKYKFTQTESIEKPKKKAFKSIAGCNATFSDKGTRDQMPTNTYESKIARVVEAMSAFSGVGGGAAFDAMSGDNPDDNKNDKLIKKKKKTFNTIREAASHAHVHPWVDKRVNTVDGKGVVMDMVPMHNGHQAHVRLDDGRVKKYFKHKSASMSDVRLHKEEVEISEKAPPGMEHVVRALKRKFPGDEGHAFATAWSMYNKKHGIKEGFTDGDGVGGAGADLPDLTTPASLQYIIPPQKSNATMTNNKVNKVKRLATTFKEEKEAPATEEEQDVLKTPNMMYNDYDQALNAAKKLLQGQRETDGRGYVLKNKHAGRAGDKEYTVIFNKTLLSKAPDWEAKGYTIVAWVSEKDGVVVRTKDGKYVKEADAPAET